MFEKIWIVIMVEYVYLCSVIQLFGILKLKLKMVKRSRKVATNRYNISETDFKTAVASPGIFDEGTLIYNIVPTYIPI